MNPQSITNVLTSMTSAPPTMLAQSLHDLAADAGLGDELTSLVRQYIDARGRLEELKAEAKDATKQVEGAWEIVRECALHLLEPDMVDDALLHAPVEQQSERRLSAAEAIAEMEQAGMSQFAILVRVREMGADAYRAGVALSENPHTSRALRNDWAAGWNDAAAADVEQEAAR